ncbi:hypothetical protein AAY473_024142, partial [Plecturocebus cupreus]
MPDLRLAQTPARPRPALRWAAPGGGRHSPNHRDEALWCSRAAVGRGSGLENTVSGAASVVLRSRLRSRSRHLIPHAECGPLAERRLQRGAGFQPAGLTRSLAFPVLALGRPQRCFPPGASFSRQEDASSGTAGGEPRRTRRGSGPGWLPGPALRLSGRQTSS